MRLRAVALAALAAGTVGAGCSVATAVPPPAPPPTDAEMAMFWSEPTDLAQRDLFIGPWGPEHAPDPAAVMDQTDLKDRVADAIARLPEREKLVVALYYYENLTLREIGEVLGVTESRVSQLHTKAVLRLRSRLVD